MTRSHEPLGGVTRRLPGGRFLSSSAFLHAVGAGGDLTLAVLCVQALAGLWASELYAIVRTEIAATIMTLGAAFAIAPFATHGFWANLFRQLGLPTLRRKPTEPRPLAPAIAALVTLLAGYAILLPFVRQASWLQLAALSGFVVHRVVTSFRSKEVFWRSIGTVFAFLLFALLVNPFPSTGYLEPTSLTPLLAFGALYYALLAAIAFRSDPRPHPT